VACATWIATSTGHDYAVVACATWIATSTGHDYAPDYVRARHEKLTAKSTKGLQTTFTRSSPVDHASIPHCPLAKVHLSAWYLSALPTMSDAQQTPGSDTLNPMVSTVLCW